MDGFKAFKYYTALKLHFSTPTFDVFVNRGNLRGSYQTFARRNDRALFEKLAKKFPSDRDFIQYVAANLMYGNPDIVYQAEAADANYVEYKRRKQSITRVFTDDLDKIAHSGAWLNFSGHNIPGVLQLMLSGQITLETLVILNDFDDLVSKFKRSSAATFFDSDLLRIEKSKQFVKYNSYKVMGPYMQFLEEVQGTTHGQDLPSATAHV